MFRAKQLIPLLLFAAYLILEAVYFVGKRVAPAYPDIRTSDVGEAQSVLKGRTTYQFYPVDVPCKGKLMLNYLGSLKGKAEKQPKMTFTLVSETEKESLLKPDTSISHFNKITARGENLYLSIFQRRKIYTLRLNVSEPGRYYLMVGNVMTTVLKGENIYYFMTSTREKLKCFWPYLVLVLRNAAIAFLILFFAVHLYLRTENVWRFLIAFLAFGLLSFVVSATPFNVLKSAMEGPQSRKLLTAEVNEELKNGDTVLRIPVKSCSPFAAGMLKVKGRALDSSQHSLVYVDLYKGSSYDDPQTENLMTFFGKGSRQQVFIIDTVHAFYEDLSLRMWHEGGGGAFIEKVSLVEAKLPPTYLKTFLGLAQFFFPSFLIFWGASYLTFCFLLVYFKRDFYSKLATFALAVISIVILLAPIYSFGFEEPMLQTTNERWLMGLKPMSFYTLIWHNRPKPDITPEELETPVAGSMTVASFSDHVLGGRNELYPDDADTFMRFFTRFFSNIRMSVRREMVVLEGFRLVRLNNAYLMLRMIAWVWLAGLIIGSLCQAVRIVIKGERS